MDIQQQSTQLPFTIVRRKKAAPLPPPATPASIQAIQAVDIDRAVSVLPQEKTTVTKAFDVSSLLPASQTPEAIASMIVENAFAKIRVKNGLHTAADLLAVLTDNAVKPFLESITLPRLGKSSAPASHKSNGRKTSAPRKATKAAGKPRGKAPGKAVPDGIILKAAGTEGAKVPRPDLLKELKGYVKANDGFSMLQTENRIGELLSEKKLGSSKGKGGGYYRL